MKTTAIKQCASRLSDRGVVYEQLTHSLSVYKVSKAGMESLFNISRGDTQIILTLSHAKLLLQSLVRLIEDRTVTGTLPTYGLMESVKAGKLVERR